MLRRYNPPQCLRTTVFAWGTHASKQLQTAGSGKRKENGTHISGTKDLCPMGA